MLERKSQRHHNLGANVVSPYPVMKSNHTLLSSIEYARIYIGSLTIKAANKQIRRVPGCI